MKYNREHTGWWRFLFRSITPGPVLVRFVYPLLEAKERFRRSHVEPASEAIKLWVGAIAAKFMLRLPGRSAEAVGVIDSEWSRRIADALACPDNDHIPRCADAGKLTGSCIVMHNGLMVRALGYYGPGMLNLLVRNRGVHEPQEERAFGEVLPFMPRGATMVELGAYWGFYSLWFASHVPGAHCFLFEPDPRNLEAGRQNFQLNGLKASFSRAAVGNQFSTQLKTAPVVTLGKLFKDKGLAHVNLLHADIQGAELDMLLEADDVFAPGRVDYIFLSTHTLDLHRACREYLQSRNYRILCSASRDESYSVDGVLVAKRNGVAGPDALTISRKQASVGN
jgi:predicted O-methyltransferase YrrM